MLAKVVFGLGLGLSLVQGAAAAPVDHHPIRRDPTFDISRIEHHEDQHLLAKISEYFITFTTGDFEGMRDLQADDFHITDIRKNLLSHYTAHSLMTCY